MLVDFPWEFGSRLRRKSIWGVSESLTEDLVRCITCGIDDFQRELPCDVKSVVGAIDDNGWTINEELPSGNFSLEAGYFTPDLWGGVEVRVRFLIMDKET